MLIKTKNEQQSMMIALKNLMKCKCDPPLDVFTKHIISKNIKILHPFVDNIAESLKIEGEKEYNKELNKLFNEYATNVTQIPGTNKATGQVPKEKKEEYDIKAKELNEKFHDFLEAREKMEADYEQYMKSTDEIEGLLIIRLKGNQIIDADFSALVDIVDVIEIKDDKKK